MATDQSKSVSFRHKLLEEKEANETKPFQAKDSVSLQKSRYLMVESTEEGLRRLAHQQTYILEKKVSKNPREAKRHLEDLPLELRFCKD